MRLKVPGSSPGGGTKNGHTALAIVGRACGQLDHKSLVNLVNKSREDN